MVLGILKGRVYEPLMTTLDVENPEDAVFLENSIPTKDLVAFGAEARAIIQQLKWLNAESLISCRTPVI